MHSIALCCAVLCCAVQCSAVLCCAVLGGGMYRCVPQVPLNASSVADLELCMCLQMPTNHARQALVNIEFRMPQTDLLNAVAACDLSSQSSIGLSLALQAVACFASLRRPAAANGAPPLMAPAGRPPAGCQPAGGRCGSPSGAGCPGLHR